MATQARGFLSLTTGDTAALTSAGGFTRLNATSLPALVTAASGLYEFDSPSPGRLRYQGALAKTVKLTALLSTRWEEVASANLAYRLAKNGSAVGDAATRSQSSGAGHVGVVVRAVLDLVAGDEIEVGAETTADGDLLVTGLTIDAEESLTDVPVGIGSAGSGIDWPALEDQTNAIIRDSVLGEQVIYTKAGETPLAIRALFDLDGMEVDLESGLRVATGQPQLFVKNSDLGRAAARDDLVSALGQDYVVSSVKPGARGWSHCKLYEA